MRRYRTRKRGVPSERRRYRLATIPDGLHVVKRPYAEGPNAKPWWEQRDPGRAVLVPLTPELEDAIAHTMHPLSGYPAVEGYRSEPFGELRQDRPVFTEWERLLHDLLLGALRRHPHSPQDA